MWIFIQTLIEIAFASLVIAAFYLFFSTKNNEAKNTKGSQRKQNNGVEVVDRGVNTDETMLCPVLPVDGSDGEGLNKLPPLRIPFGVSLRSKRGRGSLSAKSVVHGQICSDSGYSSYAASREMPPAECAANTVKELFGSSGGTLALAGCFVYIPPNALKSDIEIELQCHFENPTSQDSEFMDMTPTIGLTPSGLRFCRPITIILSSYYDAINPDDPVDVKIQSKQDGEDWTLCKVVKHNLQKKIIFQVDHFTRFKGILESIFCRLLKKQLYYTAFVKRYQFPNVSTKLALYWCVCDNLPCTVQQITTEMGEHYEKVVESETVELRYGQHVSIELKPTAHIDVLPQIHVFANDDLWPQRAVRKQVFELHRAESGKEDHVIMSFTMKVKRGNDDSYSQLREGKGDLQWTQPLSPCPNHITIIRDSVISNLSLNT